MKNEINKSKKIISTTQLKAAIRAYKLKGLIIHLPPKAYKKHASQTVRSTIESLCKDFVLTPFLRAIPKRPGAHPGKGLPSKRDTIEALYGLNRYRTDQIEALEKKWVRKAIKYALKNNEKASPALALRLKRENAKHYEKVLAAKKKEAKIAAFAERMSKAIIADESLPYAGAIIDLTQPEVSKDLNSVALPLAENALVFVAVYPKNLPNALKLIESLELKYVDNVVWDRDVQLPTGAWSKNQHTNILIALKGQPTEPVNEFQLESVHFNHKTTELLSLPDYYFSMMEEMYPGEQYLEVFSCRQYSDKWNVLKINKKEEEN